MPYVALHNHSYYSLLDSTMAVDDIVAAAVEYGMPAVGLVDRDTVAGAVQFYKQARAAGIHPVIGSEVTVGGRRLARCCWSKMPRATATSAGCSPPASSIPAA